MVRENKHKESRYIFGGYSSYFMIIVYTLYSQQDNIKYIIKHTHIYTYIYIYIYMHALIFNVRSGDVVKKRSAKTSVSQLLHELYTGLIYKLAQRLMS